MARDGQLLCGLLLLVFILQIPLLLSSCSVHAVVDATAVAGRRVLQVPVQPQSVKVKVRGKVTAHPRSMERRRRSSMFMNVSKHQVPTGANPDSN